MSPRHLARSIALAAALCLLVAGCRTNRLAQAQPGIAAVLPVVVQGGGPEVVVGGGGFTTGDPFEDMTIDSAAFGISRGLEARLDAVVPPEVVEDAVLAAVRDGFTEAFGAVVVDRRSAPHDAVLSLQVVRYGFFASHLSSPMESYVEVRAVLRDVPEGAVVWETVERVSVSSTPAAVIGGPGVGAGENAAMLMQMSDEQLQSAFSGLATRAARAVLRRLHHDAEGRG